MTRKYYEMLAVWYKEYVSGVACCPDHSPKFMAEALAKQLAQDNPRFNTEKFLEACGV